MNFPPDLQLVLVAAGAVSLISLLAMLVRAHAYGAKPKLAKAAGSQLAGVRYAFGQGMLPWEKESVTRHLPTYYAGILYHLGVVAGFLVLLAALLGLTIPVDLLAVLLGLLTAGFLAGLGLLIKRLARPHMRFISVADDYISNLVVDLFLLLALLASLSTAFVMPFAVMAIVLLLYIPLGKIRHCVFFFYTRVLFGKFFGRRGVLPHP